MRAIVLLAVAGFVSAANLRVCDPLLPQIAGELGTTVGEAGAIVTAFAVSYGLFQIVVGPLGDAQGKLRMVVLGCVWAGVATMACAVMHGLAQFALLRFLAGVAPRPSFRWPWPGSATSSPTSVASRFWRASPPARSWASSSVRLPAACSGSSSAGAGPCCFSVSGTFLPAPCWRSRCGGSPLAYRCRACALGRSARQPRYPAAALGARPARHHLPRRRADVRRARLCRRRPASAVRHRLRAWSESWRRSASAPSFTSWLPALVARLGQPALAVGVDAARGRLRGAGCHAMAMAGAAGHRLIGLGYYMLHNTLQTNATQMVPEARGLAVSLFAFVLFTGQSVGVALAGRMDRYGGAADIPDRRGGCWSSPLVPPPA